MTKALVDNSTPYLEMIEHVKSSTPDGKVLLSFSGGKDAWGCWLAIKEHFDVYPFYYYLVPGLDFVETYLNYAENILGRHIVRLPNPRFYEMLNDCVFQPPERWPLIPRLHLPKISFDDVSRAAEESFQIPQMCYTAIGVRSADSPRRAMAMRRHGTINLKRRVFYPVWDWNKDRLLTAIEANNIKLPIDYKLFGRTFDGIYLLYIYQIKKHFYRDYQKILDWFPLVDLEIFKYEQHLKRNPL